MIGEMLTEERTLSCTFLRKNTTNNSQHCFLHHQSLLYQSLLIQSLPIQSLPIQSLLIQSLLTQQSQHSTSHQDTQACSPRYKRIQNSERSSHNLPLSFLHSLVKCSQFFTVMQIMSSRKCSSWTEFAEALLAWKFDTHDTPVQIDSSFSKKTLKVLGNFAVETLHVLHVQL